MGLTRVLIVDDSVTIRAMLEQVISADATCQVVGVASDVDAARALMRSSAPDVVTLDLTMPGVDGLCFLRALKGHRHPPIVVVSSASRVGNWEVAEALEAGAAACFDKAKLLSDLPQFISMLKRSARMYRMVSNIAANTGNTQRAKPIAANHDGGLDRSLLYVSRQSLTVADADQAIARIVTHARVRNLALGITGALACTRNHFAQLLEGPKILLEETMHRIERDERHSELTVLRVSALDRRQLPDWSMAYSGPSSYVARQIEPLIGGLGETRSAGTERLLNLLIGLANAEVA